MSSLLRHNSDAAGVPALASIPSPQSPDYDWVLVSGFIVILTQVGFAFIGAGSVRYKNSQSVVIKVFLGLFLTVLIWWLFGYGFSFGDDFQTKFLGGTKLAGAKWEATAYGNDYTNFVFRASGAAVGTAILAGAAAERMTFLGWSIFSVLYSGFIYAGLTHWTLAAGWYSQILMRFELLKQSYQNSQKWQIDIQQSIISMKIISRLSTLGYKDFSGAGVVFFAAGVAGLILTVLLKPRKARFDNGATLDFNRHSPLYIGFGSLLVLAGWLFYNGGVVSQGAKTQYVQGLVAVNTLIAGATGGFFSYVIRHFQYGTSNLAALSRGVLCGLVAVSAAADDMKPWTAFLYGAIAALIYSFLAKVMPAAHIDDPAEVVSVYLGSGFVGIVLSALFDTKAGAFYGFGAKLLGKQFLGLLIIFAWVAIFTLIILLAFKGFGILRIDAETENVGIDKALCLGEAIVFANQVDEVPLVQQTELGNLRSSQLGSGLRSGFK